MIKGVALLLAVSMISSGVLAYGAVDDQVRIGILLPHTGSLHSSGVVMQAATDIAIADFNTYLQENDISWRLVAVSEDTGTDPNQTLSKIKEMHKDGIDIIIGPGGSGQLASVMNFADQNNILIVSPGSTAPSLAIADDTIYRTVPDDTSQGAAFGAIMWHDDIRATVPIWRGDVYGDDLVVATVADFTERGGVTHQGVRYDPASVNFDEYISELSSIIRDVAAEHGWGHTAVMVIAFDEIRDLLLTASESDILRDVRWVSNEPVIQSGVESDIILSEFAADVRLVTIQQFFNLTERGGLVQDMLTEQFGTAPTVFAYPAYDAVWLVGLSVLKAGDTNPDSLRDVIHDVAMSGINGTLSSTALNSAGDLERSQVNFEARTPIDGEWILGQTYHGLTDTVISECQIEVIVSIKSGFDIISDTLTYRCDEYHMPGYVSEHAHQR